MATYIGLLGFTDQGIRNVKQTVERGEAVKKMAEKAGAKLKETYWTLGAYDVVAIVEAPNDETAMSFLLGVGSLGNVRTQTLRAFSGEEMRSILAKMP